jgi:hypothetical protein
VKKLWFRGADEEEDRGAVVGGLLADHGISVRNARRRHLHGAFSEAAI